MSRAIVDSVSDPASGPSSTGLRGQLWPVVLWAGLAFAFAPTLDDAYRNLVQQPWTRATLVFPVLAWVAARAEPPSEASRSGWALIVLGIVIQQIAIFGGLERAGKVGFIVAAIGLCRWAGWCSLPAASLLGFLLPLPHLVVALGSPWLEGWLAAGAAFLARSLGFAVFHDRDGLVSDGMTLQLADRDGGLGLAVLLAGLVWFVWQRGSIRSAGRLAVLAAVGIVAAGAIQLGSITVSGILLAVGEGDSAGTARAFLDRVPWLVTWTFGLALALNHRRAEGGGGARSVRRRGTIMRQRGEVIGLLSLLVLTGVCAWSLSFRPELAGDAKSLNQLPAELAGWTAVDVPIEQDVADMLRADLNVQRAYVHSLGYVVFVYVGYYGTARGGTPEHTPEMCYPAQGWKILQSAPVDLGGESGLVAREFVVEKDGERRLVHFWYRTEDKTGIQSTAALRWSHFWRRLSAGRGDGALVRLDTPIELGDVDGARQKLVAMDRALESALAEVWPIESVTEPGAS